MEWIHPDKPYRISDDKEQLQLDRIYELLQSSYWGAKRSRGTVAASIEASVCLGLYDASGQIGFLRAVTDSVTFTWICDVIVHPDHRGHGLGKWLMTCITGHPAVINTSMALGTRDAHGLYEQYGFTRVEMMRRMHPGSAAAVLPAQ